MSFMEKIKAMFSGGSADEHSHDGHDHSHDGHDHAHNGHDHSHDAVDEMTPAAAPSSETSPSESDRTTP